MIFQAINFKKLIAVLLIVFLFVFGLNNNKIFSQTCEQEKGKVTCSEGEKPCCPDGLKPRCRDGELKCCKKKEDGSEVY